MTPEQAKAQMTLATESAKAQRELNEQIIVSNLDASDRILMRKAADNVLQLSQVMALATADPI